MASNNPRWEGHERKTWKRDSRHIVKEPDTQCNGKKRGAVNEYCNKSAGWGTDHPGIGRCKWHGGAAPGYQEKAKELQARIDMEQYGLPIDIDPHTALLEELCRTAGHVEWLRERVAEIETRHMHAPVGGGRGAIPEEKPHVFIGMYQTERTHLARVAKSCIDAGIEERKVRIAEQQGQLFAGMIKLILADLGVLDHPDAPKVVRNRLMELSADQVKELPVAA